LIKRAIASCGPRLGHGFFAFQQEKDSVAISSSSTVTFRRRISGTNGKVRSPARDGVCRQPRRGRSSVTGLPSATRPSSKKPAGCPPTDPASDLSPLSRSNASDQATAADGDYDSRFRDAAEHL